MHTICNIYIIVCCMCIYVYTQTYMLTPPPTHIYTVFLQLPKGLIVISHSVIYDVSTFNMIALGSGEINLFVSKSKAKWSMFQVSYSEKLSQLKLKALSFHHVLDIFSSVMGNQQPDLQSMTKICSWGEINYKKGHQFCLVKEFWKLSDKR